MATRRANWQERCTCLALLFCRAACAAFVLGVQPGTSLHPARVSRSLSAPIAIKGCSTGQQLSGARLSEVHLNPVNGKPQSSVLETHSFDAQQVYRDYGFDPNECASVELSDLHNKLYEYMLERIPVSHFEGAMRATEFVFDDSDGAPYVRLRVGVGFAEFYHEFNNQTFHIRALHQRRGPPIGTQCGITMWHNLVLFVEGKNNHAVLEHLLTAVLQEQRPRPDPDEVVIYRYERLYWEDQGVRAARSLESVVLPAASKQALVADLDDFLSEETRAWYREHGISYKRSYLLHGSPGAGKSSLLLALAGAYRRNLCVIAASADDLTDSSLADALQQAPRNSFLVLEDVDALFSPDRTSKTRNQLTFSGLLNALDGVQSDGHGNILVLSTNHRERLDPALLRPGRVDLHVPFGAATAEQMEALFASFYPAADPEHARSFRERLLGALEGRPVSMATLQEHFIRHRKSPPATAALHAPQVLADLEARADTPQPPPPLPAPQHRKGRRVPRRGGRQEG